MSQRSGLTDNNMAMLAILKIVFIIFALVFCSGAVTFLFMEARRVADLAAFESRQDSLTAALLQANQRSVALQDSVLAGEIEGFKLRCYFVERAP